MPNQVEFCANSLKKEERDHLVFLKSNIELNEIQLNLSHLLIILQRIYLFTEFIFYLRPMSEFSENNTKEDKLINRQAEIVF